MLRTVSASAPGHSTHTAAHSTSAAKGDAKNSFEADVWQSCFKVRSLPACTTWKEMGLQYFLLGFYGRVLCQRCMLKHLILILLLTVTSLFLHFGNIGPCSLFLILARDQKLPYLQWLLGPYLGREGGEERRRLGQGCWGATAALGGEVWFLWCLNIVYSSLVPFLYTWFDELGQKIGEK